MRPAPFPWAETMAVGFGRLHLSSRDFWALTPREFAAALDGIFGRAAAPLDRGAFERLAGRYPDKTGV